MYTICVGILCLLKMSPPGDILRVWEGVIESGGDESEPGPPYNNKRYRVGVGEGGHDEDENGIPSGGGRAIVD